MVQSKSSNRVKKSVGNTNKMKVIKSFHSAKEFVSSKSASIISIPMNLGQPSFGLDLAPSGIIDLGLMKLLGSNGWRLNQLPPVILKTTDESKFYNNAKNCFLVGKSCELINNVVKNECTNGNFQLILGGDHCISIGTIPPIFKNKPNTGVVWVNLKNMI
jgi:arginase family enzyme